MNAAQKAKLKKLADHLIGGKLGHEKFNFADFNSFPPNHRGPRNVCGTIGCAIGECPIVFPDDWEFDAEGLPGLIKEGYACTAGASAFFGITGPEAYALFMPGLSADAEKLKRLPEESTAEEVGRHILRFLKIKETAE